MHCSVRASSLFKRAGTPALARSEPPSPWMPCAQDFLCVAVSSTRAINYSFDADPTSLRWAFPSQHSAHAHPNECLGLARCHNSYACWPWAASDRLSTPPACTVSTRARRRRPSTAARSRRSPGRRLLQPPGMHTGVRRPGAAASSACDGGDDAAVGAPMMLLTLREHGAALWRAQRREGVGGEAA